MEETLFYVFGIALVALALVLSAVGLRFEGFPGSRAVLAGTLALTALLVVGTAAFGVLSAREEQEHREAELAEEQADEAEADTGEADTGEEGETGAPPPGEAPDGAADGQEVFTATAVPSCGSCHTLQAAGTSGVTGPNLDETLQGASPAYIEQSIVDPNAEIAQGFSPNIMPDTYGEDLTPEQVQALVNFLADNT